MVKVVCELFILDGWRVGGGDEMGKGSSLSSGRIIFGYLVVLGVFWIGGGNSDIENIFLD